MFLSCKNIISKSTNVYEVLIEVLISKPVHVNYSVLVLSKLKNRRFSLQKDSKQYGYNAKQLFTDTDSFFIKLVPIMCRS